MNQTNRGPSEGPALLVARVTREQRWSHLAFATIALATGIALLGLGVLLFDFAIITSAMLICLGTFLAIAGAALCLPQLNGDIHNTLIVNSKTITVKYRRRRVRILKRRDCIACTDDGKVLFGRDGERIPIVVEWPFGYNHGVQFLRPFFAWWWPETTLETIREHALANSCTFRRTLAAILLGKAPIFLAFYFCLFHNLHMTIAFACCFLLTPLTEWLVLRTNLDGTWLYRYPLDFSEASEHDLEVLHAES